MSARMPEALAPRACLYAHRPELPSDLVGDTGFEPLTSSVSVISGTHDDASTRVSEVRGCTQMSRRMLDRLTSSLTGRIGSPEATGTPEARVQAAEHLGRTAVASVDRPLAKGSWLGVRTTGWIVELARSSGVTQKASASQTRPPLNHSTVGVEPEEPAGSDFWGP